MIWQSIPLMTVIDLVIMAAVGYGLWELVRRRARLQDGGSSAGPVLTIAGLVVAAVFYGVDLYVMHVLPLQTSREASMALMTDLHLNFSWLVMLATIGLVVAGSMLSNRSLSGLIDELRKREVDHRALVDTLKNKETALRDSEQRFKDFADSASDWFWETDADHRFTTFSGLSNLAVGPWPEVAVGQTRHERRLAEDGDNAKWAAHQASLDGHRGFREFRYSVRDEDGALQHVQSSGKPVFGAGGAFLGYRGVGANITEQVAAETQARSARELLFNAIDGLSEYFMLFDANERLVMVNQAWRSANAAISAEVDAGIQFEDLMRLSVRAGQLPEAEGREQDWIRERLARFRMPRGRFEIEREGGHYVSVLDYKVATGLTATITTDITERKKAEDALRESESSLRRSVLDAPIPIMIHAEDGEVVMINRQWTTLTGYEHNEIPTISIWTQLAYGPLGSTERYRKRINSQYGIEELTSSSVHPVATKTGDLRIWDFRSSPLGKLPDSRRVVISMAMDVTERRQAEEQLRQAQKMEAVGQLTAGVAHDFNNMLAVIMGNAELLGDRLDEDDPQLVAVFQGARRAADLTQRLLAFSRKQMLKPEVVDANKLIADTTGLLRRTLEEHIDIETVAAAGLWNCEVDPAQLENVMVNLAINARDAMPDGGKLTIETANVRLDEDYAAAQDDVKPGQYVMLAVSDTGSGMPPEVREHVFEPFFTTKEVGAGSGLGLSMVYGFVKQSGGHVTIYSEPGEGTAIKLYLPRTTETEAVERHSMSDAVPVARGETVLVVEDDPDVRALAVTLLRGLGYEVLHAGTAAAALEQLGLATRINLLLTDVMLPGGMNGRALTDEVERRAPAVKVLYMSGYTENSIIHHSRLDAGVDLLQKPFSRADLAGAVRRALDGGTA